MRDNFINNIEYLKLRFLSFPIKALGVLIAIIIFPIYMAFTYYCKAIDEMLQKRLEELESLCKDGKDISGFRTCKCIKNDKLSERNKIRNQAIDECLKIIKEHGFDYSDWNMCPEHEVRYQLCVNVTGEYQDLIKEIEKLKGEKA